MSLDVHVHMGGLPPAKKPIVVSSVFDASVNRMVVTAVSPCEMGKCTSMTSENLSSESSPKQSVPSTTAVSPERQKSPTSSLREGE